MRDVRLQGLSWPGKDGVMKKHRRRMILILGMLSVFVASVTTAEPPLSSPYHFEMLEGQGVEVCEACLKAFEAIAWGPDEVGLSGCERNYESAFGLSAPSWTELEPLKHLALLKKVMMFLSPVDPESHVGRGLAPLEGTIYENDDTFKRQIKGEMKYERIAISRAMIDIDNDGRPEPVFKYRDGNCPNPNAPPPPRAMGPSRALVVLTSDRKGIDRNKTDIVMQNDGKRPGHPVGNPGGRIYDVFSMMGVTYFDVWDNEGLNPDTVYLYQAKGYMVSRICKYRYERYSRAESQGGRP